VQKRLLSGIPLTLTELAGTHGFNDRLVDCTTSESVIAGAG
jgi:hypothetical protein